MGIALILAVGWPAGPVWAQEKLNPAGNWKLTATTQNGRTIESTLVLKRDGDKLSGVYTGPRGGETPIEEVKLNGNELSFKVTREMDGQKFTSKFQGKLSGDQIKGTVDFDFAGQTGTIDFAGKRTKEPTKISGTWKIAVKEDDGRTIERFVTWKHDGTKLSGLYSGANLMESPVEEPKLQDDELTFQVSRERNGQKMVFKYRGKVSGDTIAGKMDFDIGGETGTLPFEAKRVIQQANAVGTWKLLITTDAGQTIEPTLKLTREGEKLSGIYVSPLGETTMDQLKLDGNELSFQVTRERDGRKFIVKYMGKIDGDAIRGTADYDFDGQTGSVDFEGKRAAEPK